MSDLDDKLLEILAKGYAYTLVNKNKGQEINVAVKTEITVDLDAIKQAFMDEGYMTGADWYNEFVAEVNQLHVKFFRFAGSKRVSRQVSRQIEKAAKRAARIES